MRQTALDIRDLGGRGVPIPGDLSDGATRRQILEDALGRLGRIDILVNNASAAYHLPFERYSEKRHLVAFELNCRAAGAEVSRVGRPSGPRPGRGEVPRYLESPSGLPSLQEG